MTVYFEAPIDGKAAAVHNLVPELNVLRPKTTLFVPDGRCAPGDLNAQFVGEGFSVCSALLLKKDATNTYGLFHIFPGQSIEPELQTLFKLQGAAGILVAGSESTSKRRILGELSTLFGIEVSRTIPIDTVRPGKGSPKDRVWPFHLVFRPLFNEILIARISHRDVLTYKAF